ncbi:MAG: hypothetical protein M1472_00815 [Planctomycetes bacterium]|nr:hypothetical protein [Planctomycetota bacterium]
MATATDEKYLKIITDALSVCLPYRPKFGQGKQSGLSLTEFQSLYNADSFYSWFGLGTPLMYAAHKAAGGMTSVYRQIGISCERLVMQIVKDQLGLNDNDVQWSYTIKLTRGRERRLSLDGRIPIGAIKRNEARQLVSEWLKLSAGDLKLPQESGAGLRGAVFEIRQGYKSKDSKRQNADVANASNAYAHRYIPVVLLLSSQIDEDIAERYGRSRWLLLRGTTNGTSLDSSYVFMKDVVGYDLADFFRRNSEAIKDKIEIVLRKLLSEA